MSAVHGWPATADEQTRHVYEGELEAIQRVDVDALLREFQQRCEAVVFATTEAATTQRVIERTVLRNELLALYLGQRAARAALNAAEWPTRTGQCNAGGGRNGGRCPNPATALCESVRVLSGGRRTRAWFPRCERHLMSGARREIDRPTEPVHDGDASRVLFTEALP